jgi:hypothetical protein
MSKGKGDSTRSLSGLMSKLKKDSIFIKNIITHKKPVLSSSFSSQFKKITSLSLIVSTVFASSIYSTNSFAEDFRGKPSNPYISYHYVNKPISNVTYVYNAGTPVYGFDPDKGIVVDYFDHSMANPLSAAQNVSNDLGFDPSTLNMSGIKQNSKSIRDRLANLNVKGCWESAGATYHLDPWLLFAYAKTESSYNATAMNRNSNGSYDIGLMQINSSWLPTLKRYGIGAQDLLNPCRSIFVGAWIAAQNIQRFGYNIDGIGAYNSPGNLTIRRRYASKVYENYQYLVKEFYYRPRGQ